MEILKHGKKSGCKYFKCWECDCEYSVSENEMKRTEKMEDYIYKCEGKLRRHRVLWDITESRCPECGYLNEEMEIAGSDDFSIKKETAEKLQNENISERRY